MVFNPSFIGVQSLGQSLLINELINNYKSFLDWGFLNIGGFTNVSIPTANISNFNLHILKPTKDPNYPANTVWQTPRKDWVYESGISYSGIQPNNFSGVYIGSSFYPAPTGTSSLGYKIDYPDGRIVFNQPVPSGSSVSASYSYKNIQIYKMEEFPYWKEIQQAVLENKTGFNLSDKGEFSISAEKRIQLPAVIIEAVARSSSKPLQLGDISQIVEQDLLFHILSDNPRDKNNIIDILRLQKDRMLFLYNTDNVVKSGLYPLNYDGSKNINGQNYDIIVNDPTYQWTKCRIKDVTVSDINFINIRLYGAIIRITNEVLVYNQDTSLCN